jgi:hypothetical protein
VRNEDWCTQHGDDREITRWRYRIAKSEHDLLCIEEEMEIQSFNSFPAEIRNPSHVLGFLGFLSFLISKRFALPQDLQ